MYILKLGIFRIAATSPACLFRLDGSPQVTIQCLESALSISLAPVTLLAEISLCHQGLGRVKKNKKTGDPDGRFIFLNQA